MVSYSKYILIVLPAAALAASAVLWWQRKEKKRTYIEVGRVRELYVYPVKSCKGMRITEAKCFQEGIEFDRHWIILDENDQFVAQRKDPKLALVIPHFEGDKYLCLDAPGMKPLQLTIHKNEEETKNIRVYGINAEGQYAGDEASEWFSKYLNRPNCTLYKLSKPRPIDMEEKRSLAMPDDKVSFSDFAPYLIASEATLRRVNEELQSPITMHRFRPNIVISGPEAFGEYKWEGKRIRVGDMEFRFVMICSRVLSSFGLCQEHDRLWPQPKQQVHESKTSGSSVYSQKFETTMVVNSYFWGDGVMRIYHGTLFPGPLPNGFSHPPHTQPRSQGSLRSWEQFCISWCQFH